MNELLISFELLALWTLKAHLYITVGYATVRNSVTEHVKDS